MCLHFSHPVVDVILKDLVGERGLNVVIPLSALAAKDKQDLHRLDDVLHPSDHVDAFQRHLLTPLLLLGSISSSFTISFCAWMFMLNLLAYVEERTA